MKKIIRLTESDLKRIVRRVLKEGPINVPQSEILKSGVLLDLINSNLEKYKKEEVDYSSPIVDFKDFFKLTDNEGNPINVSVGIYNDDSDYAGGRMDTENNTLLINVSSWTKESPTDLNYFEELITHELVHSLDPLIRNKKLYANYYDKKGAEPSGDYEKYRKSQHEYKAELTPLINKIDRLVKGDKYKIEWIFWLLSNIEYYSSPQEIFLNTKSYFENAGDAPIKISEDDFWEFINYFFNVVKPWSSKPSLMKRFKKELYVALS